MNVSSRLYKRQVVCSTPRTHTASSPRCSAFGGCLHTPPRTAVSSKLIGSALHRGFPASVTCQSSRVAAHSGVHGAAPSISPETSRDPLLSLWRNDYDHLYIHGKLLGAGSFGNVYLGVHRRTGGEVAVKVMPKKRGHLSRDKTISRISKEVGVLHSLQDCRNVVRLYGCFDDEEEVQVVMEYCSGGDLQRALEVEGLFSEKDLAVVSYEVLKIINACHEKSVLHGDIKPANFVFSCPRTPSVPLNFGEEWLRAVDFGCSQYLPDGERLARRVGTPAYMAPEVFSRNAGLEADMWSLGVMLFQLYTGKFPFWDGPIQPGVTGVEEVMEAVLYSPLMVEDSMFPSLSSEGKDFILRCLHRDYNQRLTVAEALHHPWFCSTLCRSNIIPTGSYFAVERGCLAQC